MFARRVGFAICVALAMTAPFALAGEALNFSSGTYRIDFCDSILSLREGSTQNAAQTCEAAQRSGDLSKRFHLRLFEGNWTVAPALSGLAPSQRLMPVTWQGLDCLQATMVMICRAPQDTDVPISAGVSLRSHTGLFVMATNVGAFDLIDTEN